MGFSRQEYWSGLPFPPPGGLPHPGIKPASPALTGRFLPLGPPEKPLKRHGIYTQNTQHIIKYYSVMRKKEFLSFSTMWMDFDHIMLSEISQRQVLYGNTKM